MPADAPEGPAPQEITEPAKYSRAFDNIVNGPDDVVGLLAYALFKEAVRERVSQGEPSNNVHRNPPASEVKIYREAAEQRLANIIDNGIAQATAGIQVNAVGSAIKSTELVLDSSIDAAVARIEKKITDRTGMAGAVATNVVAWIISLAITIVILVLANRDGIEDTAVRGADRLMGSPKQATQGVPQ
jgi:hypothetical protein